MLDSVGLATLQSTDLTKGVADVSWATDNSTSFAACMTDGRLEVWDLSRRPHDPIIVHYPEHLRGTDRTFCRFATNSPVLVCGDGTGVVAVMRVYGTEIPLLSHQEQVDRILRVVSQNESKK